MNALMRALASIDADEAEAALPLPEAQIATLKEWGGVFADYRPWSVGDLITPRKGSGYDGVGLPHLVVELLGYPVTCTDKPGSPQFGAQFDTRIVRMVRNGDISQYLVEGWQFERYSGPGSVAL